MKDRWAEIGAAARAEDAAKRQARETAGMAEALAWYADPRNYERNEMGIIPALVDQGAKAKRARRRR